MVEEHLALAEKHIAIGIECLSKQRRILSELKRDGHDTAQAEATLAQFELLQALHTQDRDRQLTELAELSE
jgi:hypothetical protein